MSVNMKKILSLLLLFAILLMLAACGATDVPETTSDVTTEPLKTLKVLAIGNSFSVDAMEHLYAVAKAEGVQEIVLGNLYIGGCSLSKHWTNAQSDEAAYTYYKNTTGAWEKTESTSLLYGLQDEQWDLITMQQASADSGIPDTYGILEKMIGYVNANKTNPEAKLAWHMTWAYQGNSTHSAFSKYGNSQQAMYLSIVNAVQKQVIPKKEISILLPVGTAIQNARAGMFGDVLTRDGRHLNDMGRVIASYTWYAAISGQPLQTVNLQQAAGIKAFTDAQKAAIVEAVNSAIAEPCAVTQP